MTAPSSIDFCGETIKNSLKEVTDDDGCQISGEYFFSHGTITIMFQFYDSFRNDDGGQELRDKWGIGVWDTNCPCDLDHVSLKLSCRVVSSERMVKRRALRILQTMRYFIAKDYFELIGRIGNRHCGKCEE